MRILHVVPHWTPLSGGIHTTLPGMCRALAGAGRSVRILATRLPGERSAPPEGLDLALVPARTGLFRWSPSIGTALDEGVRWADLVVLHTLWHHPGLAASRRCRRLGVPYVVLPQGMLEAWSLARKPLRKRIALALFEGRNLDGAAALHWTSELERTNSGARGLGSRGFVVPLALEDAWVEGPRDPGPFRAAHPALAEDPILLFLGRLHPKKRIDLAIRALPAVRARRPGARLVLAGPGEPAHVRRLERLVRSLDLASVVHRVGLLDRPMVASAIAASSVVLLTSEEENFGLAAVEAMALGRPVIVGPAVGVAAEVREARAGRVVDLEVDSVADAAVEVLSGDGESMGARGAALVAARFVWSRVAPRLVAVYEDVVAGTRQSRDWTG